MQKDFCDLCGKEIRPGDKHNLSISKNDKPT
jgi:hypothetical protein